ncbi:hypothetical protein UPYG_G00181540 [Umbra pygmaea]|uniref:Immunoglobulin V-set domain-containing protein n=1 Tax=Umbra pygmaea TaxID=75934 RepID=A0ABD0WQP6_UMBPY
MFLLTTVIFWLAGTCDGVQRLTCPYGKEKNTSQRLVWCKQTSTLCCTGFSFNMQSQSLDEGRLEVSQGADSFTVNILDLAQDEGMYWCGVLGTNDTIIKLSEKYIYSTSGSYVWNILRWILMPLLPMATIVTYFYSKQQKKKTEDLCMDITSVREQ